MTEEPCPFVHFMLFILYIIQSRTFHDYSFKFFPSWFSLFSHLSATLIFVVSVFPEGFFLINSSQDFLNLLVRYINRPLFRKGRLSSRSHLRGSVTLDHTNSFCHCGYTDLISLVPPLPPVTFAQVTDIDYIQHNLNCSDLLSLRVLSGYQQCLSVNNSTSELEIGGFWPFTSDSVTNPRIEIHPL